MHCLCLDGRNSRRNDHVHPGVTLPSLLTGATNDKKKVIKNQSQRSISKDQKVKKRIYHMYKI